MHAPVIIDRKVSYTVGILAARNFTSCLRCLKKLGAITRPFKNNWAIACSQEINFGIIT